MSKKQYYQKRSFWLFPAALFFLLLIGILISVIQIQQNQTIQSNANVNTTIAPTSSLKNCDVSQEQMTITAAEQQMFDLINVYRGQYGFAPLNWSNSLKRASAWLSSDMITHKTLSHTDSLGRDAAMRIQNCGYQSPAVIAENIDSGVADALLTVGAWEHSPPHNANLLNSNYKEAGISLASNSASAYWTLDLGGAIPTPTTAPTKPLTPTITKNPQITSTPTITRSFTTVTPAPSPTVNNLPTPTVYNAPYQTPVPTKPFTPTNTPTPSATPTPTTDPGFIANPNDTQLFVSVKETGIGTGGNHNPKHMSRHVQVGLYDMNNKSVITGNGYLTYDKVTYFRGVVHFGKVDDGTYYVKILVDHTLQTVVMPYFQTITNTKLNVMPPVIVVQGDINDDNVIDINDFNIALSCFQDNKCDNRDLIDFNDDGVTDAVDYNILLHDYWQSQGD